MPEEYCFTEISKKFLSKGDYLLEFLSNLRTSHPEHRPVKKDVFSTGELRMKAGPASKRRSTRSLDSSEALAGPAACAQSCGSSHPMTSRTAV